MERKYNSFDIAAEVYENIKFPGFFKSKRKYGNISVEDLKVKFDNNPYKLKKGRYILIETKEDFSLNFEKVLEKHLKSLILNQIPKKGKILVVGLGNEEYSPDALGPKTAKLINANMHLKTRNNQVAVILPGVLSKTGLETADIIKALVDKEKIDLVIAIDSLATRKIDRLNKVIQLTDTGISPGAGIGNYRKRLVQEFLKIPVIAIGVATVVDSYSLIYDYIDKVNASKIEKDKFIKAINTIDEPKLFLTPKEIDIELNQLSEVIAKTLNKIL